MQSLHGKRFQSNQGVAIQVQLVIRFPVLVPPVYLFREENGN